MTCRTWFEVPLHGFVRSSCYLHQSRKGRKKEILEEDTVLVDHPMDTRSLKLLLLLDHNNIMRGTFWYTDSGLRLGIVWYDQIDQEKLPSVQKKPGVEDCHHFLLVMNKSWFEIKIPSICATIGAARVGNGAGVGAGFAWLLASCWRACLIAMRVSKSWETTSTYTWTSGAGRAGARLNRLSLQRRDSLVMAKTSSSIAWLWTLLNPHTMVEYG